MNQSYEGELDGEDTEFDELEDFEFGGEEMERFDATEALDETEEMELASQLLEITDEAELDQFIGRLIKRAGRAVGQFAAIGRRPRIGREFLKAPPKRRCRFSAARSAAISAGRQVPEWEPACGQSQQLVRPGA